MELGWVGIHIPEDCGGLGLGCVELSLVLEQMGHRLLCAPFFSSICLAANAVLLAGSREQRRELLPQLVSGEKTASLAWQQPGAADWREEAVGVRAQKTDRGWQLDGTLCYVLHGHTADFLVTAAQLAPDGGLGLFWLPAELEGLQRTRLQTMDQTRPQAELQFQAVQVPETALLGEAAQGAQVLAQTLQLASVALAAEQAGGARRCLEMAVEYTAERRQFGRPIASFQAVKHKCADMMLRVESMRSAAWYAACIAQEFLSGGVLACELPEASAVAQSYCAEGFFHCAAENLQLHGGVGFTWEYDVHLYFKRARAAETCLGGPDWHRERLAAAVLAPMAEEAGT